MDSVSRKCFHISDSLRALYLGDNDFEIIPPEIGKLKNLQIVSKGIIYNWYLIVVKF